MGNRILIASHGSQSTAWRSEDGRRAILAFASAGHESGEEPTVLNAIVGVASSLPAESCSRIVHMVFEEISALTAQGKVTQPSWGFAVAGVDILETAVECFAIGTQYAFWRNKEWFIRQPPASPTDLSNFVEIASWRREGQYEPPSFRARFPMHDGLALAITDLANFDRQRAQAHLESLTARSRDCSEEQLAAEFHMLTGGSSRSLLHVL